jgi:hypothetical protein
MLLDLPIPLASDKLMDRVAGLIRETVRNRETYAESIKKARSVIESIPDIHVATQMCAARKVRARAYAGDDFTTLAAWNHVSTGGALEYLRQRWHGRLADAVQEDRLSYGPRFARIPCQLPFGIDFWSQRDVFLMRPIPRRIKQPGGNSSQFSLPSEAILVAGRGQLEEGNLFGRVELAVFGASSSIVTGDTIALLPRGGLGDILYVFLSTKLGLSLLRGCAIGTSIPAMHLDLLRKVPIPDLNEQICLEATGNLRAAAKARLKALKAENEAIRIIEEEVLPKWLV